MSYSNVQRRRATAVALWATSIAFSHQPAGRRVALAAAAATIAGALAGHQLDEREALRLAWDAGYRQAQVDRRAEL